MQHFNVNFTPNIDEHELAVNSNSQRDSVDFSANRWNGIDGHDAEHIGRECSARSNDAVEWEHWRRRRGRHDDEQQQQRDRFDWK